MRLRRLKVLPLPELNNTSRFILPVIRLNLDTLRRYGFVNSYVSDHGYEVLYDNHIYLLFNPKFTKDFEHFCSIMRQHELFEDEYDCLGDLGKVMFVFKIPEKFSEILSSFKKGDYSKFPKEYIESYFSKVTDKGDLSMRWKVLTRNSSLREDIENKIKAKLDKDAELWSSPYMHEEIYNYNANLEIEQWGKSAIVSQNSL